MMKEQRGGKDWMVKNQRHNAGSMILYGDPALAPFAKRAKHLLSARAESVGKDRFKVKIEVGRLIDGQPGMDFGTLPANRLFDYFSLRSDPAKTSPQLELYRVVPLPDGARGVPALKVTSAKSGGKDIPTGTLQLAVEDTPGGKRLHVRVPLQIPLFGMRILALAQEGITVELEGNATESAMQKVKKPADK